MTRLRSFELRRGNAGLWRSFRLRYAEFTRRIAWPDKVRAHVKGASRLKDNYI